MDSLTISIIGGIIGGLIVAILGWANRPNGEEFILEKFMKSVIKSTVGGALTVWLVIQTGAELTFWAAFFTALLGGPGLDILTQEGWQVARKQNK